MPYLTVNGLTIPVTDASGGLEYSAHGEDGKSFFNRGFVSRKGIGMSISGETTPQKPDTADTLAGILGQKGHWWSFDVDAWSDRGAGPVNGDYTIVPGGLASFGGNMLLPDVGQNVYFDLGLGDRWTVDLTSCDRTTGVGTFRIGGTSDLVKFINGVPAGGPNGVFSVSNGILSINPAVGVSQMLVCNFVISGDLYPEIAQSILAGDPFPMRALVVDGSANTYLETRPREMMGQAITSKYTQGSIGGTWYNNLQRVGFKLDEREVYY